MISIEYEYRILCDPHFFSWLKTNKTKDKTADILFKLLRIKSSSAHHKKEHNVILERDYKKLEQNGILKRIESVRELYNVFRGAVKPVQEEDFLNEYEDPISKRVVYAIYLSNKRPFKTVIFTDPEHESKYHDNEHFKGVKSVTVVSGDVAIDKINKLNNKFLINRSYK
ncbi:MAG: hypothetical protein B6U68_02985 [Candidatus Aenigmarchaeota archaeon ex4484_14]|nr:MAG: hypothetical protein B6U68_02985 [Candidatus Aenigmarchaeota archaeon ex4484_14]